MVAEWRDCKLGDVVELKRGYDLPDRDRIPGAVPIVSSSGPSGLHVEAKVRGPGVVTGRYGTIGQVFFVDQDFWPLNTTLYVRDFKGNDPRFVSYFLRTIDFLAYSDKAAVPGLNRNHLHEAIVRVPPLHHQEAIARVLTVLDEKIALNRQMSETLEAISRALFKSWFVHFDPVRAKMAGRAPFGMDTATAAAFPNDVAPGDVPRGWSLRPLGDLADVLETGCRPAGGIKGISSGVPSLGAESIVRIGHFDFAKTRYVPREFFDGMSKGRVEDRDVLLYKDGGRPGEFEPHVAMFGDGFPFSEFAINEHVYRIRVREPLTQLYLYFQLSSDAVMEEMRRKGTGVAIPGLNSTAARSLSILVPPPAIVRTFDALVAPMAARIFLNGRESRTLAELRDLLLPRLMSGELRIRDAEKAVEQVI